MSNKTVLRNGLLIDPSQNIEEIKDILVEDGKVKAIDSPNQIPEQPDLTEIDCKNYWVTPGLIDIHVHFREPGETIKETIASGLKSASAGGFSSVACMANTKPVNDHAQITKLMKEQAKAANSARLFPIGAVSMNLSGKKLSQIAGLADAGCVALSDDGMPVMDSKLMRSAMEYAKSFDLPIISHAEDFSLSKGAPMNEGQHSTELGLKGNPEESEEILVAREIALARLTGAHVHIGHLSSRLALEHVKRAKEDGLNVTAEVTPHHLVLSDKHVNEYDSCSKMAPPLRSDENLEILVEGLNKGYIEAIASDHAPHDPELKTKPFDCCANGIIGLQTTLPITLELVKKNKLSKKRWIESLTHSASKILGLNLGTLKVGAVADITVIDPKLTWELNEKTNFSKSNNSPFWNQTLTGAAVYTFVQGRMIYEHQ